MIETVQKALQEWNSITDGRQKLQHAYIVSAAALVLMAGVLGLINYDLGQKVLFVAILAVAMFFVNAVAWALLQSFVLLRIGADKTVERIAPTAVRKSSKKSAAESRKK